MKITLFLLLITTCLTCFGQVEKYDLYKLFEKNNIKERRAFSYYIDTSGKETLKDTIEVLNCNSKNKSIYILEPKLDRSHSYFFSDYGAILAHSYRAMGKKDSTITKYNYITDGQGFLIKKDWTEQGDTVGYELTKYNENGNPIEIIKFMYAWTSKFEYSYNLIDSISNYKEYELTYIDTGMVFRLDAETFYEYDSLGRKIKSEKHWWAKRSRQDMVATHLYIYDAQGNLAEEKIKDGYLQYTIKYKYDLQGHLVFKAHYDILDNISYPKSWKYDLNGNLIEIVDQGYKEVYEYNSLGLYIKRVKYNDRGEISHITRYFYEYNE